MARRPWWPKTIGAQIALVQNFQGKINLYQTELGLSAAQVTAVQGLCDAIWSTYQMTDQCKATMQALTQWRDLVLYGEPKGDPSGDPPAFPVTGASAYTRGSVDQFFGFREIIVAAPGY